MASERILHQGQGCANGCNAPFGVRCSVCNTENRAEPPSEMPAPHPSVVSVQMDTVRYRYAAGTWLREDSGYSDRTIVYGETVELLDEIRRLRRWQAEATIVLGYWDNAYERANIPGLLGDSKPTLMLAEIERLRAELDEAHERLAAWSDNYISPEEVAEMIERMKRDRGMS